MSAFLLEFRLALGIDECRRGVGKAAFRIVEGGVALGLDEDSPSRSQAPQRIVQPPSDGDEFSRHRAIEIRTAEPRCALEAAILVEDDAFVDQRRPGQEIRETGASGGDIRRGSSSGDASDAEMAGDAQMAAHHIDERGIALRRPNRGGVSDHPEHQPGDPQAKAEAQCRGQSPVQDRNGARRPAEQDRFRQRPVNGSNEAWNGFVGGQVAIRSAPRRRRRRTTERSSTRRTRSTDRTRSGSAAEIRRRCRRTPGSARSR